MASDTARAIPLNLRACAVACVVWGVMSSGPAFAQANARPFEIGGQIAATNLGQFDGHDVGLGGRVGWRPLEMLGLEAELNFFPRDFPHRSAFTQARTEGLFGATIGPTFSRLRAFGRLRPGFVSFAEAPRPIVCIAIFPPPLSCTLAAGRTLLAVDVGGGIELSVTPKAFLRVDAGDRIVRYPGPTFDANLVVRSDPFFDHDFRFAAGAALRF